MVWKDKSTLSILKSKIPQSTMTFLLTGHPTLLVGRKASPPTKQQLGISLLSRTMCRSIAEELGSCSCFFPRALAFAPQFLLLQYLL